MVKHTICGCIFLPPAVAALCLVLAACGNTGSGQGAAVAPPPAAAIALDSTAIAEGSAATLTWSSSNATSCSATGSWTGAVPTSGTAPQMPAAAGIYTYVLNCTGAGGSATASAVLTVLNLPASQMIGSGMADGAGNVSITLANPGQGATLAVSVMSGTLPVAGALVSVYATGSDAGAVVYAIAAGGNSGNGINLASKLAVILGIRSDFAGAAVINPLTTIATVWSMAQFMDSSGAISGIDPGLQNAAATAASLVVPASGETAAGLSAVGNSPDSINTLADLLAACAASSGLSSSQCSGLFSASQPANAKQVEDTLSAALAIARNPAGNVAALYAIAAADSSYMPQLGTAPSDWTLSLSFGGGGLSSPTGVAFDAAGDAWVANYNDRVSEFSPAGTALSPDTGITGGGLHESFGIAVDASGSIWVTNQQSSSSVNAGNGSLTKLDPSGTIVSGVGYSGGGLYFPYALAVDDLGNVWTANYGDSSLSKFDNNGNPVSPSAGYSGGGLSFPVSLAVDATDNVWVANNGASAVSAFSQNGIALSPQNGYSGGGISAGQGIAVDSGGNVWSTNYYVASVSEINANGASVSPLQGYAGGGLSSPGGIAIDGAGRIWVADYREQRISELEGSADAAPGTPISPVSGFTSVLLDGPFQPAIDSAGNLWVTNYFSNKLVKFVGIAAPVRTPLIGPPQAAGSP